MKPETRHFMRWMALVVVMTLLGGVGLYAIEKYAAGAADDNDSTPARIEE